MLVAAISGGENLGVMLIGVLFVFFFAIYQLLSLFFRGIPGFRKAIEEAHEKPIYSLGGFSQLDQDYIDVINALVKDYLDRGGKLVFYLAPFHPKFYEFMINDEKYKIVNDVEIQFRQLAKNYAIPVVGSFDPFRLSLSENDFYDGMHLKRSATENLFRTQLQSFN